MKTPLGPLVCATLAILMMSGCKSFSASTPNGTISSGRGVQEVRNTPSR